MPTDPYAVLQALLRAEAARGRRTDHAHRLPEPAPAPRPATERPPGIQQENTDLTRLRRAGTRPGAAEGGAATGA
ncbi:hypothetical protein GCM10022244_36500 [Streptomyces gulbargensis]|uniref:Uncharacterized protein n=1 Tax=Streptomyces gulbargensis TaxID=364901 RepID=A0ABP7ML16_9ACTN